MNREIQHPTADGGDVTNRIQSAQIAKKALRAFQRLNLGGLDPAECLQIPHPGGLQAQEGFSEVEALDFGEFA